MAFEAALKQMPGPTVTAVEIVGVAPIEVLHTGRHFGGFKE
jgi:hypothetical protein